MHYFLFKSSRTYLALNLSTLQLKLRMKRFHSMSLHILACKDQSQLIKKVLGRCVMSEVLYIVCKNQDL
jgi:hypothetical protein